MTLSLEDLKRSKAQAIEAKKREKSKPKPKVSRPKKDRHKRFTEGGEEQWEGSIAYPKSFTRKDGTVGYETYQLNTGEWSFSPKPDGPISLYGARSNRLFRWNDATKQVVIVDGSVEVWWNDAQGVQRGLASHPQALEARQRYEERMRGWYASRSES